MTFITYVEGILNVIKNWLERIGPQNSVHISRRKPQP